MANQLNMATVQSILHLHSSRWSGRRIAEELTSIARRSRGMCGWPENRHRPTRGKSNPANAPIG